MASSPIEGFRITDISSGCLTESLNELVIICITLLICLFGHVENGIVTWLLGFHIKKSTFTIYILNLAIADCGFLLGLIILLILLILEMYNCFISDFPMHLHIFEALVILTYSTSLYLLTAVSAERYLSVLCPIWYRLHWPTYLSALMCALLWAVSVLLTGLTFSYCFPSTYSCMCYYMIISFCIVNFGIFPLIMIISSLTLLIKVHYRSQRHQPQRFYIAILLSILFFLGLAGPISAQYMFSFLNFTSFAGFFEWCVCLMLASVNSSINPMIYFLVVNYRKQWLRGSVKLALQRVFEEKTDPLEGNESLRSEAVETTASVSAGLILGKAALETQVSLDHRAP